MVSLTTAAYLFACAIAEASTLLAGEMIDASVLSGVDTALTGLETGAINILDEPKLAESFAILRRVVGAGMVEMVHSGAELISEQEERTCEPKRRVH